MKVKLGEAALMSCALLQSIMLGGEYVERADRLEDLGERLRRSISDALRATAPNEQSIYPDVIISVALSATERNEMADLLELYSRKKPMSWSTFSMGLGLDQFSVKPEDLEVVSRQLRHER